MGKYKEQMKNLPMKRKMRRSIGVVTLVAMIIGIILISGMVYISSNIKTLYQGPLTNISNIGDVKYGLTDLQRSINRLIIEGLENVESKDDSTGYTAFEGTVSEDISLIEVGVAELEKQCTSTKAKEVMSRLKDGIDRGEDIRPQLMNLLKEGKFNEAYEFNTNTYLPIVNEVKSVANELQAMIEADAISTYKSSETISYVLFAIGAALIVFLMLFSTYLSNVITEAISVPVSQMEEAAKLMYNGDMSGWKIIEYKSDDELGNVAHSLRGTMKTLQDYIVEISDTLQNIAKGDLTKDSDEITDFRGDFGTIKQSFVYILKNFNRTLTNIQLTSAQVESGSRELSHTADDLSAGATDQASAVEELTATIETVSNLAETSASQTQEAYNDISSAVKIAESERKKMDSLIEEMKTIIDISKQIEEITATIEDIASQTSLLALNASIEAARAGDAGRGFAVVAEQIGKLATDSSNSAVDTKELIAKTLQEINNGNLIAQSVAEAFENTIRQMEEFAQIAQATTETARSQAEALEQVEEGIEQISGAAQSAAASTEESSAISEQLAQRAQELDRLVKDFTLYRQ